MWLIFVMFQVKPINFDGMSRSSANILNVWISQASVATQLRWNGSPCNSYIESFFGNLSVKEYWIWSTFAEVMVNSQVYFETHCSSHEYSYLWRYDWSADDTKEGRHLKLCPDIIWKQVPAFRPLWLVPLIPCCTLFHIPVQKHIFLCACGASRIYVIGFISTVAETS